MLRRIQRFSSVQLTADKYSVKRLDFAKLNDLGIDFVFCF